ncbi:unnamed protein product, partial [Parascedosporium putredinis]
TAAVLAVTE